MVTQAVYASVLLELGHHEIKMWATKHSFTGNLGELIVNVSKQSYETVLMKLLAQATS